METRAVGVVAACIMALTAGCLGATAPATEPQGDGLPPDLRDGLPTESRLASVPFYELTESSTFLAKGVGYVRYIIHVSQPILHARLFFTTDRGQSEAPAASIDDDQYHYEFMQVRPLGQKVRLVDANPAGQFRSSAVGHSYALTYLYGAGVNAPYLAPYAGNPNDWEFSPGYYEVIVATDEKLTVGVNIDLGTEQWSTYYHPQELGSTRPLALSYNFDAVASDGTVRAEDRSFASGTLSAHLGEIAYLYTFADLFYDVRPGPAGIGFSVDARGEALARLNLEESRQRLAVSTVGAARQEALAFAALFNEPGPFVATTDASVTLEESLSFNAARVVQTLVFGVAVKPTSTLAGLPVAAQDAP
jgi:hypothetical protein